MARTTGNFLNIYQQARNYMADNSGKPLDPVVRYDGRQWMIESALEPADGAWFEDALDDFCDYWYEGMGDHEYTPSDSDIADYISACGGMVARGREAQIDWAAKTYGLSRDDAETVLSRMDVENWGGEVPTNGGVIDDPDIADKNCGHTGYWAAFDGGSAVLVTNGDPYWTERWQFDDEWRDDAGL